MTESRTFLVTGALGAIGVWTMRSLLARGHHVVALDAGADAHRLALALDEQQLGAVARVTADITDLAAMQRVLDEHHIDGVIHLAALQVPFVRANPMLGAHINVVGTVNVLEAVRRRGAMSPVVYASSIAAYGAKGTLDGSDPPQTLYGVFKRTNEATALRYFEDFGVASVGLRPHTVYGPARDQGMTSAPTVAMLAAAARVPYEIPFGGTVQLQYAPDVGEAFARTALLAPAGAAVHNLDGDVVAIADLVALINDHAPAGAPAITAQAAPLPLVERVDAASFVSLLGGSVMRPVPDGVRDALSRFQRLLAQGHVAAPPS